MVDSEIELKRISEFLDALKLNKSSNISFDSYGKDLYRKFHALLCWQKVLDGDNLLLEAEAFNEFLSDCSAAYFFHLTSAYKPSISMLRSSVENLVRSLLIIEGLTTDAIEAVWELFAVARSHFLRTGSNAIVIRIDALYSRYREMCKTVHSASLEYMSLRVPFEKLFEVDVDKFRITQTLMRDVFRISAEALYLTKNGDLGELHHRLADEIRDALSPSTKALIG